MGGQLGLGEIAMNFRIVALSVLALSACKIAGDDGTKKPPAVSQVKEAPMAATPDSLARLYSWSKSCDRFGCSDSYRVTITHNTAKIATRTTLLNRTQADTTAPARFALAAAGDTTIITVQVSPVRQGSVAVAKAFAFRYPGPLAPQLAVAPDSVRITAPAVAADTTKLSVTATSYGGSGTLALTVLRDNVVSGTSAANPATFTVPRPAPGATTTIKACGTTTVPGSTSPSVCSAAVSYTTPSAPPPPDTVTPPPPPPLTGGDSIITERVDLTLHACQRQYIIGTNLQVALDTVKRGDCMRLPAGSVYTGNFRLRAKPGTGWIQIYSASTFPDTGVRFQPTKYPNVATIRTPNVMPALETDPSPDVSYYRIMGVKFDVVTSANMAYAITSFHNNAATAVSQIPHHIILDRIWVYGHPGLDTQRCVQLNSAHSAVINSWLEGCHHTGSDAQAVAVWNSPGPLAIINNYLEGSGENIMIGGADPRIPGLVPTNIVTVRNHINKPPEWQTIATHSNGLKWAVKNSVETKNVRRWYIAQNEITNNWISGQTGFILVMKSSNQSGGCGWCVAELVTVEENIFRNAPSFANFKALDEYSGGGGTGMNRIIVRNNYGSNIGAAGGRIYQLLGNSTDSTKALRDILIEGNIITGTSNNYIMLEGTSYRVAFRNNVGLRGSYGLFGNNKGEGLAAWNFYVGNYGGTASGNRLVNNLGQSLVPYPTGFTIDPSWPSNVAGVVDTVALKQKLTGVVVPR